MQSSGGFETWLNQGTESQDYSASAAFILNILIKIFFS